MQIKSRAKKIFQTFCIGQIDFAFLEITSRKPQPISERKNDEKISASPAAAAGRLRRAPEVEIEKKIEYKCGEQIISADFLDDASMIARVDGINYVLVRVAAADGRRYENTATGMTFMQNGNGTYLTIKGRNYPMCQEIVR